MYFTVQHNTVLYLYRNINYKLDALYSAVPIQSTKLKSCSTGQALNELHVKITILDVLHVFHMLHTLLAKIT